MTDKRESLADMIEQDIAERIAATRKEIERENAEWAKLTESQRAEWIAARAAKYADIPDCERCEECNNAVDDCQCESE